jgi:hypothetical protein
MHPDIYFSYLTIWASMNDLNQKVLKFVCAARTASV